MRVLCSHCGTPHELKTAMIGGQLRVQFRCARCGQKTAVDTGAADRTQLVTPVPDFARVGAAGGLGEPGLQGLRLPTGKVISLSVIAGPAKGEAYTLDKPRVVLGRGAGDFSIADPTISRAHCTIEVRDNVVRLRDLDSTNGIFIGEERVHAAELQHLSEFRLGSCVLLVTVTPKLAARG
jgi:Inner membrane component of T3SS, cytoplasmic domain